MNKVAAEIIAGLIPHKMTRNRWRGILRFGIFNALKLKRQLRHDNTSPDCYLAICAIAKNEGPYFKEWIDWHLSQGVDKFYIYDNESTDDTKQVLEPYIKAGIVDYTFWPGRRMQLPAYDDCLLRNRMQARWIAFIDLDEFIRPMVDSSIPAFLRRFEDSPVVEVNWLVYGSGGHKTKTEGSIMHRFRYHSLPDHYLNRHVKSIVNPKRVYNMIGCHEAARINGKAADSHGDRIRHNFRQRVPQQDVIRINHYAVKSFDEFLGKKARGRARVLQQRSLDYFTQYDLNDIYEPE